MITPGSDIGADRHDSSRDRRLNSDHTDPPGTGGGISAGHAVLLALSDERDAHLAARLAAWREGFAAGQAAHAGDYPAGYVDGALARKHAQHDAVEYARVLAARWGPGGRDHFAGPRPGDYPGGPAGLARVRASWAAAGSSLGPPGMVHLGGPAVHGGHACTPACYAHQPDWYTVAEAIAIIAALPGDYAKTLAALRAQAAGEAA